MSQISEKPTTGVNLKVSTIKELLQKWRKRVTESKWTRLFIFTSIVQSIIAIAIEAVILERNKQAFSTLQSEANNQTCTRNSMDRINNIYGENVIFILFNIFQVWFCFDAIINQNTIQIITIVVINYLIGIVAIIQIVEIIKWRKMAADCLSSFANYNLEIMSHEGPLIIASLLCATLMGFFTWKLYQAFGWNIYKKIGADPKMQGVYRTMLIFVMLLKLDLFFMIVMSIEACTVFGPTAEGPRYLSLPLYIIHATITGLIFLLQVLAYYSLNRELHAGMKIFIGLWLLTIADFIMLLVKSTQASAQDSWYFLIIYIISGILFAVLTLIWSIFVLRNFGRGLKKHFGQTSADVSPLDIRPEVPDSERPSTPNRWAIDDD